MRRPRWVQGVQGGGLGRASEQHRAGRNDLALRRSPGAQSRVQRARRVVVVRLLRAGLLHRAFDAHHPFQLNPVKLQRGDGQVGQLLTLAAVVVGVPDQASCIDTFDEHDAGRRPAIAAHGGQGHGVGLGQLRAQGLFKPALKLQQRIGRRLVFVQLVSFVALAQCLNVHRASIESSEPVAGLAARFGGPGAAFTGRLGSIPYGERRK